MQNTFFLYLLILAFIIGCGNQQESKPETIISNDPEVIEKGKAVFESRCIACHNFRALLIGPNLSGITKKADPIWIKNFIKDPKGMIDRKDERAVKLFESFQTYMPGFSDLSNEELDALISYMNTHTKIPKEVKKRKGGMKNPIKGTVKISEQPMDLEFFMQIPASHDKFPYTKIAKMVCEQSSDRLFIHDLRGMLYEIVDDRSHKFLSLDSIFSNFIEGPQLGVGFGSYAFHPEFKTNGLFYTAHSESAGSKPADFFYADSIRVKLQFVLTEWKMDNPDDKKFTGSNRELMRINYVEGVHVMQEISFNPGAQKGEPDYGLLYVAMGDGGSAGYGYPHISYHHGERIWSSMLRIDPLGNNSANGKYGIPSDNPFVYDEGKLGEIWAWGLRNPNKMTWDGQGRLLVSDIGKTNIEELNVVEPGKFYGWPIREGSFEVDPYGDMNYVYPLPENDDEFGVTYPLIQFDHNDVVAIGGGYMGKNKYEGKYIFSDIPRGIVLVADIYNTDTIITERKEIRVDNEITNFKKLCGRKSRVDLRFGYDCSGTIYAFMKADGRIYKVLD